MDKKAELISFTRNWLIAASSVVIARTLTAPLERVKIILQTQAISPHFDELGVEPYKNFWDCLIRLRHEHGFQTYWRGNGINLMRQLPSSSFTFAFNDLFKDFIVGDKENELTFQSRLGKYMLCGALAGVVTMSIMHPVALCQTLITADIGGAPENRKYLKSADCFTSVYERGGIRAFYTGYISSILGMSTYRSVYFGLFATCKHYFEDFYGVRASFLIAWPMAQVVTILASLINYPFDTISRSQQIVSLSSRRGYKHIGPIESLRDLIRIGGIGAVYKGLGANILRTIGGSLIIVGYDEIQYRFFTAEEKKRKAFVSLHQHQMEDTIWRTWSS